MFLYSLVVVILLSTATGYEWYRSPNEVLSAAKEATQLSSVMEDEWIYEMHSLTPQEVFKNLESGVMNVSKKCDKQVMHIIQNLQSSWVLVLMDAWAKLETGILQGNTNWLGMYNQCINVKSEYNSTWQSEILKFAGKYCTVEEELNTKPKLKLSIGVCVPDGCTSDDVTVIINATQHVLSPNSTTPRVVCQEKNVALTSGAIATLVVYGILVLMCFISTVYDYVDQQLSRAMEVNDDNSDTLPIVEQASKEQQTHHQKVPKSAFLKLLLCFSFYTNGIKLLSTNQSKGALKCVHGIRFLSMSWVILGHTLVFSANDVKNVPEVLGWLKRRSFMVLTNATLSVDSFFVISALLLTYLFLQSFDKNHISVIQFLKSVPIMYLHRYLRLTPSVGLMMLFYMYLMFYVIQGPLAPVYTFIDPNCESNWWTNLLYINNIIHPDKECVGWTWYLSNDFQFFLVAPFLIYGMYRFRAVGISLAVVMVITSCAAATGVSVQDKAGPGGGNDQHWFDHSYVAPWTRYQSYGVGILFGYAVWHCNGKLRITWWLNLLLWALSAILCLLPIYGPYDGQTGGHIPSIAESAIYNGWSRTSWSIGLGWLILACCTGNGGWINEFLSWKAFVPLSRMTYCAYLIHPLVMTICGASRKNLLIVDDLIYIQMFATYLCLAYVAAFVFSLLCEAPFLNLDKHFLSGQLSSKKKD